MNKLAGRVAVVTGASSGIGEQTARELARHGASVALLARRRERLEAIAADIAAAGGRAIACCVDVTDAAALAQAAPQQASRPLLLVLMLLAAALFLLRDWRVAAAAALLGGIAVFAMAIVALRGGLFLPVGSLLVTLALAFGARAAVALRERRNKS